MNKQTDYGPIRSSNEMGYGDIVTARLVIQVDVFGRVAEIDDDNDWKLRVDGDPTFLKIEGSVRAGTGMRTVMVEPYRIVNPESTAAAISNRLSRVVPFELVQCVTAGSIGG